ncbi:hypothetical protein MtrunA17_Chr3g0089621 [Medicago truncatula]|uniref:Uncharacterized protein n=1 Tax=Medicago truncatula TaxID=3880 RepID=A0A396IL40_MEDTR|nr:hypothetical protein MtrunA17_Chr3g0089621 [Medicago truncatula]
MEKHRATMVEARFLGRHWKFRATMKTHRATMVALKIKIKRIFQFVSVF